MFWYATHTDALQWRTIPCWRSAFITHAILIRKAVLSAVVF